MKRLLLVFMMIFSMVYAGTAVAGEPSSEPILKLNTKMHTSSIWRIDMDTQGYYLVTASDDKSVMVWNAKTGEYLKTLRPPIDKGNEGRVYSSAISKDGRFVAASGWTGWDWHAQCSVYIFNTSSGEMVARVTGLDSVVYDLEFSPDGKFLAATMGRNGAKIISTANWTVTASLTGYSDQSHCAAFDKKGNLVTSSFDGHLRLYDSSFQLQKDVLVQGGKKPYGLAFSPDGKKIALGYQDSPRVQVFDASSLELLYEPDIAGVDNGKNFLNTVCWSKDGKQLYAGGYYMIYVNGKWWSHMRRWEKEGKGKFKDFPLCLNTCWDIKTLTDDSFVFSGYYPDFGRFDRDGKQLYYKSSEVFSFADNDKSKLKISDDGFTIGFAPYSGAAYTFSLRERQLLEKQANFPASVTSRGGITITDWLNSTAPRLNGTQLSFLEKYERCISADISSDGGTIVFSADYSIYGLDANGTQKWKITAPGTVWSVNIADGREVFAATYSDGTVRWHRLSDGRELLALFVTNDGKRWVLWTPSGHYDSSPGGQDLIGWHVNEGTDRTASFYPAGRFASTTYRPDIGTYILDLLDVDLALQKSGESRGITDTGRKNILQSLPPTVTILSPENGATMTSALVQIQVLIKTPENDPVTEIRTLVNGRPSGEDVRGIMIRPRSKAGEPHTLKITIPEGECEISILAKNSMGYSEPATVRIIYGRVTTSGDDEFLIKPKLYILAIGVSNYNDENLRLRYPSKDAKDFTELMAKQKGALYRDVVTNLITDEKATRDSILEGLEWIQTETTSKDVAMIFIAGHGMNDNNGHLYFLPADVIVEKLKRTGLPTEEISRTVAAIAGKVIYFMDTCHSGNMTVARRGGDIDLTQALNELSSAENGAIVFCSSSGKQYSLESEKWGNGAFTKALLEGLSGKADYVGKNKITINQLDLYLSERVKELTNGKQTPVTAKPETVRDFTIVIKK